MFQPLGEQEQFHPPTTVDQVVDLLFEDLTLRDKVVMASMTENELDSSVYLAMAKTIRKEFGLYSGNAMLLESCSSYLGTTYDSFEDPAMVIIKELWKKVQDSHRLRLVSS